MLQWFKEFWNSKSRTTIMGYVRAVIMLIAATPTLLDFLPPTWTKPIVGICVILYMASNIVSGYVQKDEVKPIVEKK